MQVIWENKEGVVDGLPHLIYISREKRPNHPHNYKAGAMNVLVRYLIKYFYYERFLKLFNYIRILKNICNLVFILSLMFISKPFKSLTCDKN